MNMKIGRFQLENLTAQNIPFLFFHLGAQSGDGEVAAMIQRAQKCSADSLLKEIDELDIPKDHPIILICDQGSISEKAGTVLSDNGYLNVYIADGGVQGLCNSNSV